ncbi:GNAT family N-acetyltransferase [Arenibacter sp. GZD96]|uniref:GNAT family N-acetyltransferase n=1 Tax=Aurantibrevibacter litoralis TaxID=3106030 RepID=UPI002AFF050B|nr:GNAT family N-acetyltransferase [Arenibacter sp. GZD-96]MEA1785982.1 GNAT family N-acetyltransferase [Arenibacter sp. GZD-96]
MELTFTSAQNSPTDFFNVLPEDWRLLIAPYWDTYAPTSTIYVLKCDTEVVAGGILFGSVSPDMTPFEKEHGHIYFALGYLYIGFLWVVPKWRGAHLGSTWLQELKKEHKHQAFWLTIEEESLKEFYIKNGFQCIAENKLQGNSEWLLIYHSVNGD